MRNQLPLIEDEGSARRKPSWKLDERTRRIGLRQVTLARQQLLSAESPSRRGRPLAAAHNG
ncbi:MAG: hypothetical protein M0Z47_02495 [Actinomycetota bacterium]|nr:hypothetical protein [Actinomycetota bacterium]